MLDKYIIQVGDIDDKSGAMILNELYKIQYDVEEIMLENQDLAPHARKELPILHFMINSHGGNVDEGIAIISVIEKLKRYGCYVITECNGIALSCGFFIFLTGDLRLCTCPRFTRFLYHYAIQGMAPDNVNINIDNYELTKQRMETLKEYVVEKTNITKELLDSYDRKDWWMTYEEALELGVVKETLDEEDENVEEVKEETCSCNCKECKCDKEVEKDEQVEEEVEVKEEDGIDEL